MQQLQILQACTPKASASHFKGLGESLMFNTRLFGGTSSQDFLSSLLGDNERQLKFIKNIFRGRDDVTLYIVDHAVETPFHRILMANFIKQLGDFLSISYKLHPSTYTSAMPQYTHLGALASKAGENSVATPPFII